MATFYSVYQDFGSTAERIGYANVSNSSVVRFGTDPNIPNLRIEISVGSVIKIPRSHSASIVRDGDKTVGKAIKPKPNSFVGNFTSKDYGGFILNNAGQVIGGLDIDTVCGCSVYRIYQDKERVYLGFVEASEPVDVQLACGAALLLLFDDTS